MLHLAPEKMQPPQARQAGDWRFFLILPALFPRSPNTQTNPRNKARGGRKGWKMPTNKNTSKICLLRRHARETSSPRIKQHRHSTGDPGGASQEERLAAVMCLSDPPPPRPAVPFPSTLLPVRSEKFLSFENSGSKPQNILGEGIQPQNCPIKGQLTT